MVSIPVRVTAEHIAAAGENRMAWADPMEAALAALTGQKVSIDGGGADGGCVATIGQDDWTLVIDLPQAANAWLDRRWGGDADDRVLGSEPITLDIEIPTWIEDLLRITGESKL